MWCFCRLPEPTQEGATSRAPHLPPVRPDFFRRRFVHCFWAGAFPTAFCRRQLAVRALTSTMATSSSASAFVQALLNVETELGQAAWRQFFFDPKKVRELDASFIDSVTAQQVLQGGLRWEGGGWNTTTASRALFELCAVPLVSSQFEQYRDSWIYACALHWRVELSEFNLSEGAAAAAFALCVCFSRDGTSAHGGAEEDADEEEEEEETAPAVRLPWEEPQQKLPGTQKELWTRFAVTEEKFDVKALLERLPRYAELPGKPPENNHWQDGKSKHDKALKAVQQTVLHQLRLQSFTMEVFQSLNSTPEDQRMDKFRVLESLLQQTFAYSSNLYGKIQVERKEYSIPGSAGPGDDMLFGKEEVQQLGMKSKVNSLKIHLGGMAQTTGLGPYSFRSLPNAGRGFGFRGTKGGGSSYGSYSRGKGSWGSFRGRFGKGKGVSRDIRAGRSSILPQGEAMSAVLEGHGGLVGSAAAHYRRCWQKMAQPQAVSAAQCAVSKRNLSSQGDPGRIQRDRGCQPGSSFPLLSDQTPCSLVCVNQNRNVTGPKTPAHCRLPGNKQTPRNKAFQIRPLATHFPSFEEKHVGGEGRFEACLFPFGNKCPIETFHQDVGGAGTFSVPSGLFWTGNFTTTVDEPHEGSTKVPKSTRIAPVHLLGRHFVGGSKQNFGGEANSSIIGHFEKMWVGDQSREISITAQSRDNPLGICDRFSQWSFAGPPSKTKASQKGTGEIGDSICPVMQKDGSHFGHRPQFSCSSTNLKGFHRYFSYFCSSERQTRLGQKTAHSRVPEEPIVSSPGLAGFLERTGVSEKMQSQDSPLRFLHYGVGRGRSAVRKTGSRILAVRDRASHKHQRAKGSHGNSQEPCQSKGHRPFVGGQRGRLLIPQEGGRSPPPPQRLVSPLSPVVHGKLSEIDTEPRKIRGHAGRLSEQDAPRQGRLHTTEGKVSTTVGHFQAFYSAYCRHVCKSRKFSVAKVCLSVAPPPSHGVQCLRNGPLWHNKLLQQPPLDSDTPLVGTAKKGTPHPMFDGGALLGWQCMVAPTSKTAQAANSSGLGATSVGFIHKLPGRTDASYKMAPALSDTIRELLERKQVPAESISLHLARLTQLSRYDHPFKVFWVLVRKIT